MLTSKKLLLLSLILFVSGCMSYAQSPVSKNAQIIEYSSTDEVLIQSEGVFTGSKSDVKKNGINSAIEDAKKAAIYFLLFSGSDPLVPSSQRNKEKLIEDHFFTNDYSKFISFEETQFRKKIEIDGGKGIKVAKRFKINIKMIKNELVTLRIIEDQTDLMDKIGNPMIAVLPETEKGESPIEKLQSDPTLLHASTVIETFLTRGNYEVVNIKSQDQLNNMATATTAVTGGASDDVYKIALSIGSDVYIRYSVIFDQGGYGTQKAIVTLNAYETTTSRILGTETGYSQSRKGNESVSVEEAMNDAVGKVLTRINEYWTRDLKKGIQYKLLISINPNLAAKTEAIQNAFFTAVEAMSKSTKENIVSKSTIDMAIWVEYDELKNSRVVFNALKKAYEDELGPGVLTSISLNRKFLQIEIAE